MITSLTRRSFSRLALTSVVLAVALGLFGAVGPAHAGRAMSATFVNGDWVAIRGYDPVAYFTMGKPVEGSKEFSHEWLGTTWRFASAEHRDLFAAAPVKYAPQYGGYCSSGVAGGSTDSADPNAWRIVDGKLYLFYGEGTALRWEQRGISAEIVQGDTNWKTIKADLTQ